MDISDKMADAVFGNDLIVCGQRLIEFADDTMQEKNKRRILDLFYRRLYDGMMDYVWDGLLDKEKPPYMLVDGVNAVRKYLAFSMPISDKPLQTLEAIKALGSRIVDSFVPPVGPAIGRDATADILAYLDRTYDFSRKVFHDKRALIAILDYSHWEFNSECLINLTSAGIEQHLFLYHMKDAQDISPEAVLFHELGHALFVRYTGGFTIPKELQNLLRRYFPAALKQCTQDQLLDIVADVLSMMADSPYARFDPFANIRPEHKREFKALFESILFRLPV